MRPGQRVDDSDLDIPRTGRFAYVHGLWVWADTDTPLTADECEQMGLDPGARW